MPYGKTPFRPFLEKVLSPTAPNQVMMSLDLRGFMNKELFGNPTTHQVDEWGMEPSVIHGRSSILNCISQVTSVYAT